MRSYNIKVEVPDDEEIDKIFEYPEIQHEIKIHKDITQVEIYERKGVKHYATQG